MMLEDQRQRLDMLRRVGPKKRQTGESCSSVPFSDLSLRISSSPDKLWQPRRSHLIIKLTNSIPYDVNLETIAKLYLGKGGQGKPGTPDDLPSSLGDQFHLSVSLMP